MKNQEHPNRSASKMPKVRTTSYVRFAFLSIRLFGIIAVASGATTLASTSLTPGATASPTPTEAASPIEPSATVSPSTTPNESPSLSSTPNLTNKRSRPSGENSQPALRAQALELAAAFSNDGYKIRDGYWLSTLPPIGQELLLAVNLFSGNQYWFSAAFASPASRIALKLYNENGVLVSTQSYETNTKVALGAEPTHSGKYYLGIQLLSGAPGNFCVLYSYK